MVRGFVLQTGAAQSLSGQECKVGPHGRVRVCAEDAGVQSRAGEEPGGHRAATGAEQVECLAPKFHREGPRRGNCGGLCAQHEDEGTLQLPSQSLLQHETSHLLGS